MKTLVESLLAGFAIATVPLASAEANETAASFYEQYKNNVSSIPLPACAESSTDLTRGEIQQRHSQRSSVQQPPGYDDGPHPLRSHEKDYGLI